MCTVQAPWAQLTDSQPASNNPDNIWVQGQGSPGFSGPTAYPAAASAAALGLGDSCAVQSYTGLPTDVHRPGLDDVLQQAGDATDRTRCEQGKPDHNLCGVLAPL